ncbi:MAG: ATP-binding protein [Chloroflexi bacterium]|nr:ATP-binding protein [Chloroflexota bacterium]MCY3587946.1 ATP-binding protein [Chloroflexota bacterium]MCY3684564.1 ATP-binding protein [Chloroflexota bacterium]MDE2710102.1 ATP-binding protein [Chloroflexota bacterium]
MVGPIGVGKSFLAPVLGYAAVRAGHTVRSAPADRCFREMALARADHAVDKTFRSFLAPDLLILDATTSACTGSTTSSRSTSTN